MSVVLRQMRHQQCRGAAEHQLVAILLPLTAEQKLAIEQGYLRIFSERTLFKLNAGRAALPGLFHQMAQMLIAAIQMHKREIIAYIPARHTVFWHDAETVRAAAVAPASTCLVIGFVAVSDIQTERMVIRVFLRHAVIFI